MSTIVVLIGPISYWWGERFDTPEAVRYREWRSKVGDYLVEQGYLTVRPHEICKGNWDNRAQALHDEAIAICDIVINLNPGVPSNGTLHELELARQHNKPVIDAAPPIETYYEFNDELVLLRLRNDLGSIQTN